jgi:hypothetical protein
MLQVVFMGVANINKLGHNGYSTFAPNIVNVWTISKGLKNTFTPQRLYRKLDRIMLFL